MNPVLLRSQYLLKLPVQPNCGGPKWLRQHGPDITPWNPHPLQSSALGFCLRGLSIRKIKPNAHISRTWALECAHPYFRYLIRLYGVVNFAKCRQLTHEFRSRLVTLPNIHTWRMKWNNMNCVGFEVLTVVVMKNTMFWDTAPCIPLKLNRVQEQAEQDTSVKAGGKHPRPWRWSRYVPPTTWRYIPEDSTLHNETQSQLWTNYKIKQNKARYPKPPPTKFLHRWYTETSMLDKYLN
jgi:hypothetical protein